MYPTALINVHIENRKSIKNLDLQRTILSGMTAVNLMRELLEVSLVKLYI